MNITTGRQLFLPTKCPLDLTGEETEFQFFLVSRLPEPCFATSLPWDDLSTLPESCPSPNSICWINIWLQWGEEGIFHMKPVSSSHPIHITLKWRQWWQTSAYRLFVPFAQNSCTNGFPSRHVYKWVHFTVWICDSNTGYLSVSTVFIRK